jgi:uncharacterized protein
VITHRSTRGFFDYIGLKATTKKANYLAIVSSVIFLVGGVSLGFLSDEIREIFINPPSVTGELRKLGFGPKSVILLLIIACLKTSLSEEIFFRGFVAKRLMNGMGYLWGNIIQSLIFAIVHVLLFWALTKSDVKFLVFIFLLSGISGYVIGYIKEKYGRGSIIPGWIAHGLGNTVSYSIIAFVL